jgi:mono/diheme cytochrome c family protein
MMQLGQNSMNYFKQSVALVAVLVLAFLVSGATPQQGDAAKGKEVFDASCSTCHVADTDEAIVGPGLKNLFKWPPHKLSDGTEHTEHTVEIIRKQIVDGGGAMVGEGSSLSEQQLNDLLAYLQTL